MAERTAIRKPPVNRPPIPAGAKLLFSEKISSTPAALDSLIAEVIGVLGSCGCVDGQRAEIELALREALANAILHGNDADPRKRVELDCYQQKDRSLLLVVRDQGRGFSQGNLRNPLRPENILRAGGRGIFLIRHFMDDVRFTHGGSEIRMRKKL